MSAARGDPGQSSSSHAESADRVGDCAVELPRRNRAWRRGGRARVAGVSSFGISGTNAHVIVGEAPARARERPRASAAGISAASARTPGALSALCDRMAERVAGGRRGTWGHVLHGECGAQPVVARRCGRGELGCGDCRFACGGGPRRDAGGCAAGAERRGAEGGVPVYRTGRAICRHGAELYAGAPVFRAAIERARGGGRSGRRWRCCLRARRRTCADRETQPALFAVEWALAELWRSWGIEPAAVLGHSVGEYVAACVAGVMRSRMALRLVAARGRLMQALPGRRDGCGVGGGGPGGGAGGAIG